MMDQELKQVLEENKQLLDDIDKRMHRIEKKFVWNTIFGLIKMMVIIAPLVIGVIYFSPFLKDFFEIYKPVYQALPELFKNIGNVSGGADVGSEQTNVMLESLCNPQTRQGIIDQFCK